MNTLPADMIERLKWVAAQYVSSDNPAFKRTDHLDTPWDFGRKDGEAYVARWVLDTLGIDYRK